MSLADISVKRPTFITCVVIAMLAVGYLSFKKLGVDQFPNITFPMVFVSIPYPGAGPAEVETLISKPVEEELSTVPGIKSIRSISQESISRVIAEFSLETDVKYAEQMIKDRVSTVRKKLPSEIEEPTIKRLDPSDQPVSILSVNADLPPAKLFEFVDTKLRPKFEQINQVGLVEIYGGRKREIHIELDQRKLKNHELSAALVAQRIGLSGQNVPLGKFDEGEKERVYRTIGEYRSLSDIRNTIVNFLGNDVPVSVDQVGTVKDALKSETTRTYVNGRSSVFLQIYKQSGANTLAVVTGISKRLEELQKEIGGLEGSPKVEMVRDGGKYIRANVDDVYESITIGIILTVLVVYFFLGSFRSTLITGLALPNSLLGAFILMAAAGFTINVMTLLALSLSVGLLVDDAIVVRENIFRHIEMGKSAIAAALEGTKEVSLAVIATTLTVVAVFGPIAFLQGVVGQFFKEFGLTICFAMMISLFDAFTMAPMLSAYFAGSAHGAAKNNLLSKILRTPLTIFEFFYGIFARIYDAMLTFTLKNLGTRILIIAGGVAILLASFGAMKKVPKTFLSAQEGGEFAISLDLPPGTSLEKMDALAREIDAKVRKHPEVQLTAVTVGNNIGQTNIANFFVQLVPLKERNYTTTQYKDLIREELKPYAYANPAVKDYDFIGGGMRPFAMNIVGDDLKELEKFAGAVLERLKKHPGLTDVDWGYRPGKPELQVVVDRQKAERLGVSTNMIGQELRTQIEGVTPAVFREGGEEYDIRVFAREDQRNLKLMYPTLFVPNINNSLVRLADVSKIVATEGPATINRQDRGRYIQIQADIKADGPGMGGVIADLNKMLDRNTGDLKLPEGMRYSFVGQAENFKELVENIIIAITLSILFIFLVLASLYESFITPLTIMLVLPLAASGAFFGLFFTGKALDINSMIGMILLLGIATKNSILLVDYANQQTQKGKTRKEAMLEAGRQRLRPIIMTTIALIAGMLPVAIGLNEASRQRTSMGVAIIGGLISSTLLSLLIVPAFYEFIDRFREGSKRLMVKIFVPK